MDTAIKQTDEREMLGLWIYPTIVGNPPFYYTSFGVPTFQKSSSVAGVLKTSIVAANTGRFTPGVVKLCPATHLTCVGKSHPGTALSKRYLNGFLRDYRMMAGDIAAAHSSVSFSFNGIRPKDVISSERLIQAVAKTKDVNADIGMMLAEGGETLGMLLSPMRALPKLLRVLRKPRTIRGNPVAYAANAWLTARYGIMPTMSDIDSLRKLALDQVSGSTPFRRRGSSIRIPVSECEFSYTGSLVGNQYVGGSYRITENQTVYASAYYSGALTVGAQLGLDASSIPKLGWNLIPYSFCVDWIVDVGSWITAMVPRPGVTHLGNTISTTSEWQYIDHVKSCCVVSTLNNNYPTSPCSSTYLVRKTAYKRWVNEPLPALPVFNPSLSSWKRKLDALTLSYQRIRS